MVPRGFDEIRLEIDRVEDDFLAATPAERVRLTLLHMRLLEEMEEATAGRNVSGVTDGGGPSVS